MGQLNGEPDKVHWSKKQGNKYNKFLHPAMLTDAGFLTTAKVALLDEPRSNHRYVTVIYDRNYVINWLRVKVVKPFLNTGMTDIIQLIKEAWELTRVPQSNQIESKVELDDKV